MKKAPNPQFWGLRKLTSPQNWVLGGFPCQRLGELRCYLVATPLVGAENATLIE